jgi:4-hydroxy-tetrahydrodipicolinate reductase
MKIALIGYGKMGKMIHQLAEKAGESIVAIVDSKNPLSSSSTQKALEEADVCIDFTNPDTVVENIKILSSLKKDVVVGTTGWDDNLQEVKKIVNDAHIGLLYSPNFSIGIALFLNIIEKAAALMAPFEQYELAGLEIHHSKKIDKPSGTAKAIENRLHKISPQPSINFTSVRVGEVPGTHSIIYDSPVDTITLTHTARTREGFAGGALNAARWIKGRKGIFTLDDLLKEKL